MLSQRVLAQVIHADAAKRRGIELEPAPPLRAPGSHEVKAYRFTDTPKVGLNPVNKYATPLGTYWYPMYDEDDEKAVAQLNVEFGGDRKYVIEAIVDLRRVVVLDDVTESEFERYQRLLLKQIARVPGWAKPMKPATVLRHATEKALGDAKTSGSKKEYWGRALWYLINNLSHALTAYRHTNNSIRTATTIFNRLAQLLDIDGFLNWSDWHVSRSEKGEAKRFPIIHPQEPRQMVLFTNDPIVESQILPSSQLAKRGLAGVDPLAADAPLAALETLAKSPGTPADVLTELANRAERGVRTLVALNPFTPAETLERLARDKDSTVRLAVARNLRTPPALLDQMSRLDEDYSAWSDEASDVHTAIAENPSTSTKTLEHLWSVYSPTDPGRIPRGMRGFFTAIARNPSAPPWVLEKLADSDLESDVARNPSTPPAVLERIALERVNSFYGGSAVENPNFSQESFKKLNRDVLEDIIERTSTVNLLVRLADYADEKIRLAVAGRAITPPAILQRLADDKDKYVRKAVAHNRSTPPAVLKRLATDLPPIRAEVAGNVNTPPGILAVLAEDDHLDVRKEAAGNDKTPPRALEQLARREGDDADVYFHVALNPATPPTVLDHLASHSIPSIRNAVTEHPKVSRETLERLATTDENEVVRRHARDEVNKRFSASGSYISAKKKITRQDAKRMERDAKKHKNWKKKWVEVTKQPKKSPKGSWVGRATFEWLTGTEKGTKRSRPITLGDEATLVIRAGKLIVRPKGGEEYEYGDEESRKAAEAEQKRAEGKSPIEGLDTVQDLKKELLDNFETSLEMVDKFVRRERKRAKEGKTAASLGARLDAVVETLSGLRLPTPTVLALEVAASALHAPRRLSAGAPKGLGKVLKLRQKADNAWFSAMEFRRKGEVTKAISAFKKAAKAFTEAAVAVDEVVAWSDVEREQFKTEMLRRAEGAENDAAPRRALRSSTLHASTSFSISLIPTDEWLAKNPNDSWDWHIKRTILSKLPASAKTWDSKYDADARAALYGIFQRLMESLTDNDDLPLEEVTKAAFIEFRYLNPDNLIHRGDRVYSSEKLADVIRSGKDLAPIQAGADGPNSKVRVLDGHHRMRAYSLAKKSMPAWVGWVGAGKPATLTVSFDLTRPDVP